MPQSYTNCWFACGQVAAEGGGEQIAMCEEKFIVLTGTND
eukprot:SAG22_NODE_8665_length_638_cov_1.003711_1_plen_39_part_10